jgi:glycosyltransferase involved in cell wall biosynthesis
MGRFMSLKGFMFLVEAIAILSQRHNLPRKPVLLAFGQGGFIREEKEYISNTGLESVVRFMPFTDDPAATLRGLDVLAIPSISETCPLLPMEAMVAGVPVIGTNCIGLREVLNDSPCITVPARDSKALARALEDEMISPSLEKAQNFISCASTSFDVRHRAKQLERLVMRLFEN